MTRPRVLVPRADGVAIIAFSGLRDAEAGARAAGADAFVVKPDVEMLERALIELGGSAEINVGRAAVARRES